MEKCALKPGSKVLVRVGKNLSKGCMAVQIAKRVWRLTVVATCATADMDIVVSMGADSVIAESAVEQLDSHRPFDSVIDHVSK
jgi:NADPH:quinone reductase-like Zn-dependent oxidoreductase